MRWRETVQAIRPDGLRVTVSASISSHENTKKWLEESWFIADALSWRSSPFHDAFFQTHARKS